METAEADVVQPIVDFRFSFIIGINMPTCENIFHFANY